MDAIMTEKTFRDVFSYFLSDYWGAFHEALEAQSVTPTRLAESLFKNLQQAHLAFEGRDVGSARTALEGLGRIWQELEARRYRWPDTALKQDDVSRALALFEEIYDSLVRQGQTFSAARSEILKSAPHGTPKEPLRADAAR
jgi:hypothetical protein